MTTNNFNITFWALFPDLIGHLHYFDRFSQGQLVRSETMAVVPVLQLKVINPT